MKPQDIYGSLVFNFDIMRSRLPKETYMALQQTMETGFLHDMSGGRIISVVTQHHPVKAYLFK